MTGDDGKMLNDQVIARRDGQKVKTMVTLYTSLLTAQPPSRRATGFLLHVEHHCAVNPPVHDRQPGLASGVCLELSAIKRQDCFVIECVPGQPQNSTVQGII